MGFIGGLDLVLCQDLLTIVNIFVVGVKRKKSLAEGEVMKPMHNFVITDPHIIKFCEIKSKVKRGVRNYYLPDVKMLIEMLDACNRPEFKPSDHPNNSGEGKL